MHMIFRFSKSASLLLAALLTPTVIATAENDRKPLAQDAGWVESHEARYCDAGGRAIGEEVANTKHVELSVMTLPKERLTILKSQEEWKEFVERFARIDKESGKPAFASASGLLGDSKRTDFTPDFDSEAVVILSADKSQKEFEQGMQRFYHDNYHNPSPIGAHFSHHAIRKALEDETFFSLKPHPTK